MKIVFLMGGDGFEYKGENYPFYLTEFNNKLPLERQILYCQKINPDQIIFCIKEGDIKSYYVDEIIRQITDHSLCLPINGKTNGSICTALLAAEYIDNKKGLILMAVDDFIDVDINVVINYFKKGHYDAGVVAFSSVHPRYSFARTNNQGLVLEVAEKKPISKYALASFYYFKNGSDFVDCAKNIIRKDEKTNDSFYISQTFNEMILKGKKVGLYKISNDHFHSVKTEMQLAHYISTLNDMKESK